MSSNRNPSVNVDDSIIFEGVISTDPTLEAAKGIEFSKDSANIIIEINGDKTTLINENNYRFIYVFMNEGKYRIDYSKKPIKFL